MPTRIRYINSAGIHASEAKGLGALAELLPEKWLLYASFQYLPPRQNPLEIDAMVVMDDRVLLLELKEWNGELTANGDYWLIDGRPRGRSPVDSIAHKARVLANVIRSSIPRLSCYVDSGVVLTGTATAANLPPHQAARTWSLDQIKKIVDPRSRNSFLQPQAFKLKRPYQFEAEFDGLTLRGSRFKPLDIDWDGYRIVQADIFEHPKKVWAEHRAVLKQDSRHMALLRTWSFDRLPAGLNTVTSREKIARRELRALGYLKEVRSQLLDHNQILDVIGDTKSEILTQHYDLRELPSDFTSLARFLEKSRDELGPEDRIALAQGLLNAVAELHRRRIAHRDLGRQNTWIGSATRLALTSFTVAHLPDEESVHDFMRELSAYAPKLPEDIDPSIQSTGWQRDVYALGVLCHEILLGKSPINPDRSVTALLNLDAPFDEIRPWIEKSLARLPDDRYADAMVMADEFGRLTDEAKQPTIDQSILDKFERKENPFFKWKFVSEIASGRCQIYRSKNDANDNLIVKIWPKANRGTDAKTDIALVRLLEGASTLIVNEIVGLPKCLDCGLSPVGAYVVYREASGYPLSEISQPVELTKALELASSILLAVSNMHQLGMVHGDLCEKNIVVDLAATPVTSVLIDLFDVSEFGDGKVRSLKNYPKNWERLTDEQLDRYSTVHIVRELLSMSSDPRLADGIAMLDEELARPAIESLQPIHDALCRFSDELHRPPPPRIKICLGQGMFDEFKSDDGCYYVRINEWDNGVLRHELVGLEQRLIIVSAPHRPPSASITAPDFETLRKLVAKGDRYAAEIDVVVGPALDVRALLEALAAFPRERTTEDVQVNEGSDQQQEEEGQQNDAAAFELDSPIAELDIKKFWSRSIELEQNLVPEITISTDVVPTGSSWIAGYELKRGNFDFDPGDLVELRIPGRNKRIGRLDTAETTGAQIVIKELEAAIRQNDTLELVERQQRTSYDRRKRAIDKIVDGRCPIEELLGYFDPLKLAPIVDYGLSATEQDMSAYRLNDGQRKAFSHIIRYGPVGLLQGPPGTGKTHFIAALVHWLATHGAGRILVASQSHEAVNNAIYGIVSLYRKFRSRPSLLRIGSKNITAAVRPFHTTSVRERFGNSFNNSIKFRVASLAGAAGIDREFAADIVDVDRRLRVLAERLLHLESFRSDANATYEEVRRNDAAIRTVTRAFNNAVARLFPDLPQHSTAPETLAAAYEAVRLSYGATSNDLWTARKLVALAQEWSDALASSTRNFEEFLAKTRTVVTGTCVGLGQTRIRIDQVEYDWVIVDEAARCSPGELAVPIQLGRRILLVGDHFQLKPMIEQGVISGLSRELPHLNRSDIVRSEFERAFNSPYGRLNGQVLEEQYRMAPAICELVSQIFYEPHGVRLVTSADRRGDECFEAGRELGIFGRPITWIDTSEANAHVERTDDRNQYSFWNRAEVDAIISLLNRLVESEGLLEKLLKSEDEHPIAVISMYQAQRFHIERRIAESALPEQVRSRIRVDTVDSYQGKENTIVIVTLVRCNPSKKVGHVGSPNRCNVAISRAKERLFIVGSRKMWRSVSDKICMKMALGWIEAADKRDADIIKAANI